MIGDGGMGGVGGSVGANILLHKGKSGSLDWDWDCDVLDLGPRLSF